MSIKQSIGVIFILTILLATILTILGIWEVLSGDVTMKLVGTLIVICAGLGVSAGMLDKFFENKPKISNVDEV